MLLEYVAHTRLEASAPHARAVGRALAEIHARRFPKAGLLGPDLTLSTEFEDFVPELTRYALSTLERMERRVASELLPDVQRFFVEQRAALLEAAGPPVLLHGDFKVSNLHWAGERLLVLDWEFCYAGSALMDVGQLLRWCPPAEFVSEFAFAYREAGGELPADFQTHAQALDLVNLVGLLAKSFQGSRRERDVTLKIRRTLAESAATKSGRNIAAL